MYIIQLLLLLFYKYIDKHDIDYISSYTLIGNRRVIFHHIQLILRFS